MKSNSMQDKIKSLLTHPDEANQRLGCTMAKSILKWSNWEVVLYFIEHSLDWELYEPWSNIDIDGDTITYRGSYFSYFMGYRVLFDSFQKNNCILSFCDGVGMPLCRMIISPKRPLSSNPARFNRFKEMCNKFIEQNL